MAIASLGITDVTESYINFRDPLALYLENRDRIELELAQATNKHGEAVVIGTHVTLWGGKNPNCRGITLADRVRIYDFCRLVLDPLKPESGIALGEGSALNFGVYIDGTGGVEIGKSVIIGPNAMIVSSQHTLEPGKTFSAAGKKFAPVSIADNVWIGGHVCVMAGVSIGAGAIIAAGSVVTTDIPPACLAAGAPARPVKDLIP